jgi:hypothetical protein
MSTKKRRLPDHAAKRCFESTFGVPHMSEKFNRKAALYLLQHADESELSGLVPTSICDDGFRKISPKEAIEKLLKNTPNGANTLLVSYAKSQNDADHSGRWYAQGSANLQRLSRKLRSTLLRGLYIDLDFQNCGPTLLLNLCMEHEIVCPLLTQVVHNREHMLGELGALFTRDEAKDIVVALLYGKSASAVYIEHPDRRYDLEAIDWLPKLEQETARIYRELALCDEYEAIRTRYKHAANRNVKIVSCVLFSLENQCLERLYTFLHMKGILAYGEGVLCFDGIMVHDNPHNRERITDQLLEEAAEYIKNHLHLQVPLRIKNKPLDDGYYLPEGYAETVNECFYSIEPGNDQAAADIILEAAGDRIKKSHGRVFARLRDSVIYREGEQAVKEAIIIMTASEIVIMLSLRDGRVGHYSKNTKVNGCIPRILASPRIEDDDFSRMLWQNSLGYMAFKNGVWSFEERRLLSFEESMRRQIYFTCDTARLYPTVQQTAPGTVNATPVETARDQLINRVLEPFLPDEVLRTFFLNCLARALAGRIQDKRWFVGLGERNCGKGILCKLLEAAFGTFVRAMQAENLLLHAQGCKQDAAKAQSWVRQHEFTRLLYSNEMSKAGSSCKMDGEMMKRLCSNGDVIECRRNYEDEAQIRLQATMFLFANDVPPIDPPDAYQTMLAFKFPNEFREAEEITDPSDPIQKNWRAKDHELEAFIKQPAIIDAFTVLVFEHYTPNIQPPPDMVMEHTQSVKGPAAESPVERFKRLVQRGSHTDVLFYQEIRLAAEAAGLGRLSDAKIDEYVRKLYTLKSSKPSKMQNGKMKQDRGFRELVLCDDTFDERAERVRRIETMRHSVRSEL